MKNFLKERYIRLLIWVGYSFRMWKSILSSKKFLSKKDLTSEFLYLVESCYYTGLDEEYLKVSVKNRICGSILLMLNKNNGEVVYTSNPESLKKLIENCFSIKINKNDYGYYLEGFKNEDLKLLWKIDVPKEYKRLLELFSICLKLSKKDQGD